MEQFTNLADKHELKEGLTKVFANLDAILVNHAGPFATNAVVGSPRRQVNDIDEFTKDGIHIFKNLIVTEDVMSRFGVRMARFVGNCVDNRCHDGTTTSMLLLSRLAKLCLEKMDTELNSRERFIFLRKIKTIFNECLSFIDGIKITEEDLLARAVELGIETTLEDVRYAISYHMAMIASKGDDDLSTKVATLIKASPEKIYSIFSRSSLAVETEEKYILKHQKFDIAVNGSIGNQKHLNHRNNTEWLSEDCMVFVTDNDIVPGSWEAAFLLSFISKNKKWRIDLSGDFGTEFGWEHYHEGKKHFLIVAPLVSDPELLYEINSFNKDHPAHRISWFSATLHNRMRMSWDKTIHYMAGKPTFQEVTNTNAFSSILGSDGRQIKARIMGNELTLYNLYEKDNRVYHPYHYDDGGFERYTQFKHETESLIEFATQNVTNPSLDHHELSYLIMLYRALTCQDIHDIDVGGSIHDQRANRTVYEDAFGAALSAINEGLVFGGYMHIAKHLENLGHSDFANILYSVIADSVRADFEDIRTICHDIDTDKWNFIVADTEAYANGELVYYYLDKLDKECLEDFLRATNERPILLQAWSGYNEQFKRFGDILPKLANTTNLIDMRFDDAQSLN